MDQDYLPLDHQYQMIIPVMLNQKIFIPYNHFDLEVYQEIHNLYHQEIQLVQCLV
ncbi:Uncharacterised protein [Chlamydia trachomatis]|nr:Uncharacterised protein [Chlamydia trachomatis]